MNEITTFHIAGWNFHDGIDVLYKLQTGTAVRLVPETDNIYDADAVAVYYQDTHIGYVPRTCNKEVRKMFLSTQPLESVIDSISYDKHSVPSIEVKLLWQR
jgi:hypothetical protein